MNDDVKKIIFGTILVFLIVVGVWLSILFVSSCSFTLTCKRGELQVDRTSVPTLIPATLPAVQSNTNNETIASSDQCHVRAADFVGAWVNAGASEKEAFQFTDINGQECQSTFEQVKPLFVQSNYWYAGSLSCASCHSVDVAVSPAQLDLSSYAGIMAGSGRENADSKGTDILGSNNWENSILFEFITTEKADIPGHNDIVADLLIYAGTPLPTPPTPAPTATEIPITPTP